jgi:hypothetical protein
MYLGSASEQVSPTWKKQANANTVEQKEHENHRNPSVSPIARTKRLPVTMRLVICGTEYTCIIYSQDAHDTSMWWQKVYSTQFLYLCSRIHVGMKAAGVMQRLYRRTLSPFIVQHGYHSENPP